MNNEFKEEAEVIPDIGEASFAFLTSFSNIDFKSDELDFLSSAPKEKAATPQSPIIPAISSSDLKNRIQRLQAEKKKQQQQQQQQQQQSPMRKDTGSMKKSSSSPSLSISTKTPLHFRTSIAMDSEARRLRRQALRDSLEANSLAISEMELPAPDLMRSPSEPTMYLKSPKIKKQILQRPSSAGSLSMSRHSAATRSNHSNDGGISLASDAKGNNTNKQSKSNALPLNVPLNDDDDDDAEDIASKKSSKSKKTSAEKKGKKKDPSKEKKKRRSASAPRRTYQKETAAEEPNVISAQAAMEFSKFEFSEASFDVQVLPSLQKQPASSSFASRKQKSDSSVPSFFNDDDDDEEELHHLGEEEIVELKTSSSQNLQTHEPHPRSSSSSRERKSKGSSFRKKDHDIVEEEEDEEEWETEPNHESPETESKKKKKKRRSVSASSRRQKRSSRKVEDIDEQDENEELNDTPEKEDRKSIQEIERSLRGRLRNKLSSGNMQQDDEDETTETADKKKKRAASSSKERTLRDRFSRRQGSQGSIKGGQQEQSSPPTESPATASRRASLRDRFSRRQGSQGSIKGERQEQPSSPTDSPATASRRSSASSSLRDRFRRRQGSQGSVASGTGPQDSSTPLSPSQKSPANPQSYDSPQTPASSKVRARRSFAAFGRQSFSPATSQKSTMSPSSNHSGKSRGVRSGRRRQSMSGMAPPLTPPQQVSRSGVQIAPGRRKSRPSTASQNNNDSFRSSTRTSGVDNSSFRSRRSVGGGMPAQEADPWQSPEFGGKKTAEAFDPFGAPKATKIGESVHDTPRGRKSPLHRRSRVSGTGVEGFAAPLRGGRKPNSGNDASSAEMRAQSPGPMGSRYSASRQPTAPASPVAQRRGPMSVPMTAPAAVKRKVGMRKSQVGDIRNMMRDDSGVTATPRRSGSLKRHTINHRGGTRRSAESVERRGNIDNAMSKLIDGCTSQRPQVPF